MNYERAAHWVNMAPIVLMSGGWIGPMFLFWMQAWGPLRPYNVAAVPTPPIWQFIAVTLICMSAWWLPSAYYTPRNFERSGRLYEWLGIKQFKRVVPDGDFANSLRRRNGKTFRLIQDRASARAFLTKTVLGEKGHMVLMLAGIATAWWAFKVGWNAWGWFLSIGNALLNLYPILLQRYTRARIFRVQAGPSGTSSALPVAPS